MGRKKKIQLNEILQFKQDSELTNIEIAKKLGVSERTIYRSLKGDKPTLKQVLSGLEEAINILNHRRLICLKAKRTADSKAYTQALRFLVQLRAFV
jgi:transcriptional antiterminator